MKIENDIITVEKPIKLENGTVINRFSHVVAGAEIGDNCMIGEHCYISKAAIIGNDVRIQNLNNIWDGVVLEDNVFIAPSVCFTNHHNPHDRHNRNVFRPDKTIVKEKATICTNCTIVAPKVIGKNSIIGAGALILINIPDYVMVYGRVSSQSWATYHGENCDQEIKGRIDKSGEFVEGREKNE